MHKTHSEDCQNYNYFYPRNEKLESLDKKCTSNGFQRELASVKFSDNINWLETHPRDTQSVETQMRALFTLCGTQSVDLGEIRCFI